MFYVVSPEILINKVFWLISCLLVWLFTANSEVLLKFFFLHSVCQSRLFLHKFEHFFLMSVNSELYWFLVGHHCRHCHLWFWEIRGHGSESFRCRTQKNSSISVIVSPSCSVSQLPFFSICKRRGQLQVSTACLQFSQILSPKLSKLFHESDEVFSLIFAFFFL